MKPVPKICIAGDGGVGKTVMIEFLNWRSLVMEGKRSVNVKVVEEVESDSGVTKLKLEPPEEDPNDEFKELKALFEKLTVNNPTVMEPYEINLSYGDMKAEVIIVDTAGQDGYERVNNITYQDSEVFIFICSAVDRSSLFESSTMDKIKLSINSAPKSLKRFKCLRNRRFLLVRTKIDMINRKYEPNKEAFREEVTEKDLHEYAAQHELKSYNVASVSGILGTNMDDLIKKILELTLTKGGAGSNKKNSKGNCLQS